MQGKSAAAQSVVAKSIADPTTLAATEKLIEIVLSQSAMQGFGKSLGDLFSRRHLLDVSPDSIYKLPHLLRLLGSIAARASDTPDQPHFC